MSGIRWTLVSAVTLWAACVSPKGATPDHEVTPTAEVLNVVDDSGDSSTGQSDVGAHPADTSLGLGDVFDAESVKPDGSADVEGLGDLMDTGPDVSEVGSSDVEHEDIGGADISPDVVPIPTELACDSGDVAWVRRTLPVLLGRGLAGSGELGLLSDIVQASSRDALLEIVMRDPAFSRRWGQWVMDELRVNRVGDKKHDECFEVRGLDSDGSLPPEALARHVRELGPEVPFSGGTFTMGDLLDSALSLDDLSPVWLAHLFAMMAKPVTGANVDELPMDIARRQDFGEIFEAVYLHRNVVCAGCHNSQWATTDHPDPALDRHWSYPALFEKAIYGHSGGAPEMAVYSVFRHLDVVGGTQQPWGLSDRCGTFAEPAEIPDDPAEIEAYFIQPLGQTASIWDVVAALRLGLDSLRESGTLTVHPSSFEVEGPEAFAWMLSRRIANRVWREVMGYPLTVVHYFPRNEAQFALLTGLTELLVAEQWSLKRLLATVLTHPLYNEPTPDQGCGERGPYDLPPVFNPWTTEEEPEEQANSVGDLQHRHSARRLIDVAHHALDWPLTPAFPGLPDELFQKAVGVFVKDAEPGFDGVDFQGLLAWNARFGACAKPNSMGGALDWLDRLFEAVNARLDGDEEAGLQAPSVRDLAATIKDRMLARSELDPGEEALVAALFGLSEEEEGVETPLSQLEDWEGDARLYCGALLTSPQFLIAGAPLGSLEEAPDLRMPEDSYAARCAHWRRVAAPEWLLLCHDMEGIPKLTMTPFVPALKGAPLESCLSESCSASLQLCEAHEGCQGLYQCLQGCDHDGCAADCVDAASTAALQSVQVVLSCGEAAGCVLEPACGDDHCTNSERTLCPDDCAATQCVETLCDETLLSCDEYTGCAALSACWLACGSPACRAACRAAANEQAREDFDAVVACAVDAACVEPLCGDGVCAAEETTLTCLQDCAVCGDGVCHDLAGESSESCVDDCPKCGDALCGPAEESACPSDCFPPEGSCEEGCSGFVLGATCQCDSACPDYGDCCGDWERLCRGAGVCGDTVCDGGEGVDSCPADCFCGDEVCDVSETETCPKDCLSDLHACFLTHCESELVSCESTPECANVLPCLDNCADDGVCASECVSAAEPGVQALLQLLQTCGEQQGCFN